MWNRLLAVVEEQAQTLIRAAFSPIVRECGDISAGIFDAQGQMLAQAVTGTPGHINTMAAAVKTLRDCFPINTMRPGDIYMTNDPWLASGHLNDFLLMMPVFYRDRVVGFTSCTSHLVDLGGLGMGPDGSDVYDEGLLIPPCKLLIEGQINELLMDIVRANSREPIANEGDIYALMMDDFGINRLDELANYIIETSYQATIDVISSLPNGSYKNHLSVDGYDKALELHATLTISDKQLHVDFAGTSDCIDKGINVPLNYAAAYTVFGLRCIIGPEIPNNAGSLKPFVVDGPVGCLLNAPHPAPVAMRHTLGQMTPDLIFGCLSQALPGEIPAEGASCMYDLPMRHTSDTAMADGHQFAIELVHNGGTGARPHADGLSATAFPSGVYGSQVEITEAVAPVIIWRRELLTDSGGAGQFRGGLGQRIELTSAVDEPIQVFLSLERINNPAAGREGGGAGRAGRVQVAGRAQDIPGKCVLRIEPGERLIFDTPGGGGYGPPAKRAQSNISKDVHQGLVSAASAATNYDHHDDMR